MSDIICPQDHPHLTVYAVVGHPIAHSRSPMIHEYFAKETGQAMFYGRIDTPPENFKKVVSDFFAAGGKGLNITVPHKLAAYEMAEVHSLAAKEAQAVNTLWMKDGRLHADNTDGLGLKNDLERILATSLKQKKILIIGAGGAAQGVIQPLQAAGAALTLANRTLQKALDLKAIFPGLQVHAIDELANTGSYDLIVNATAAGLQNSSPLHKNILEKIAHPKTLMYDMVYGKNTQFMQDGQALGLSVADGLGMLVEQAAAAFTIWRGIHLTSHQKQGAIQLVRQALSQS